MSLPLAALVGSDESESPERASDKILMHDQPPRNLPSGQRPSASPTPDDAEEIEGLLRRAERMKDSVCASCGRTPAPEAILVSRAENKLIHAAVRKAAIPAPVICGGLIVPKGEEWLARLAPGNVVPCYRRGPSRRAHLVRLGHRVNPRTGSWTGTPLCHVEYSGSWFPTSPQEAGEGSMCGDCETARRRGDAR